LAILIQTRSQYTIYILHCYKHFVGHWFEVVLLVLWWSRMSWFLFDL
jgi:hypothetical protein